MMQQQLSPNQRAPFSPQPNQGKYPAVNALPKTASNPFHIVGYPPFTNSGQRLSPQQQQQLTQQQQQMAFQTGTNANNNPQLSPRQPTFPQGTQNSQQTQPNQPQTQQQQSQQQPGQPQQWSQSAINSRLSLQQQQNPMLNAQLQVSGLLAK